MKLANEQDQKIFDDWVSEQLETQSRHILGLGLIEGPVRTTIVWMMPLRLCIGKVASKHNQTRAFWVISGSTPTDHVDFKIAATAREAARHFALKWQLQSARLGAPAAAGGDAGVRDDWSEVGDKLARKAEALYTLTMEDVHWG